MAKLTYDVSNVKSNLISTANSCCMALSFEWSPISKRPINADLGKKLSSSFCIYFPMNCLDRVTSCVIITVSCKLVLHLHVVRQVNGRA